MLPVAHMQGLLSHSERTPVELCLALQILKVQLSALAVLTRSMVLTAPGPANEVVPIGDLLWDVLERKLQKETTYS